jgi:hypothetical protein
MKKTMSFGLALALALAAGWALAQDAATQAPAPVAPKTVDDLAKEKKATTFHTVNAEVVSADAAKMTITFKADGAEKTAPVSVLAKNRLTQVKAGDKVTLSCKDVEGQHVQVVSIRPATAAAVAPAPPQAPKKPEEQ